MLVLTRRENESIVIGPDVTVMIVKIGNGQVRLGITAPDDVRVDRQEVRDDPDYRGPSTATRRQTDAERLDSPLPGS